MVIYEDIMCNVYYSYVKGSISHREDILREGEELTIGLNRTSIIDGVVSLMGF